MYLGTLVQVRRRRQAFGVTSAPAILRNLLTAGSGNRMTVGTNNFMKVN